MISPCYIQCWPSPYSPVITWTLDPSNPLALRKIVTVEVYQRKIVTVKVYQRKIVTVEVYQRLLTQPFSCLYNPV